MDVVQDGNLSIYYMKPINLPPIDCQGKELEKHDMVQITNEGRYTKAHNSVGEVSRIGKGSGGDNHLTIDVKGMNKQHRIAKHVKFIVRPMDDLVKDFHNTKLNNNNASKQDFRGGKHQNT